MSERSKEKRLRAVCDVDDDALERAMHPLKGDNSCFEADGSITNPFRAEASKVFGVEYRDCTAAMLEAVRRRHGRTRSVFRRDLWQSAVPLVDVAELEARIDRELARHSTRYAKPDVPLPSGARMPDFDRSTFYQQAYDGVDLGSSDDSICVEVRVRRQQAQQSAEETLRDFYDGLAAGGAAFDEHANFNYVGIGRRYRVWGPSTRHFPPERRRGSCRRPSCSPL